jgi:ATP-dependent RNA helicase RhlE
MNTFSELTLQSFLHNNLKRNCFIQPTPVQAQAISPALEGLDVVATAQTGTGKTLAFLIPAIEKLVVADNAAASRNIRALILAPTRELALQIAESFAKLAPESGLRCAVVVGGLSEQKQLNDLRRGAQVVIATPGRLEDFMNRRLISLNAVSIAVLDEADRMLDMGFLPAIEKILSALPANRQSLFFSATMDRTVERLIQRHSNNPVYIRIAGTTARTPDQVDLHVYEVESDHKIALLRHMLAQEEGSFLVFARTKHGTDRLARKLAACGIRAVAMHGDRTQNQRNQALAGFREGRYRVLVATDVAARGIHVDSVAQVVNYDLPQAPEDFIHRVGRTGRAGQRGAASTFISRAERGDVRRIERECKVTLQRREVSLEILNELAVLPERQDFHPQREGFRPAQHENRHHEGGAHDHRSGQHRFGRNRGDRNPRPAHRTSYAHG